MRRATVLKALMKAKTESGDGRSQGPANSWSQDETANPLGHTNGPQQHEDKPIKQANVQPPEANCIPRAPLETIRELQDDPAELDSWDPMSDDYHSTKNTLLLNPDKEPECVITGEMSEGPLMVGKYQVCDFYLRYGSCADGLYCDRLHINPESRDKISFLQKAYSSRKDRTCLHYEYLSPQELEPGPESSILVSVTLFKTPTNFYFVAPYEQMSFSGFNQEEIAFYAQRIQLSSPLKTKLQKCHEQLAYLFNHNYRRDNVADIIYKGQIVACKLQDGRFCRAEIIEDINYLKDIFLYKLILLDVGIEVELPRESIYDIKVGSLTAPPMAISARLGVKPAADAGSWSQAAMDYFSGRIRSAKYMLCRVLAFERDERMYTVDLFDLEMRSSLTSGLIENGFAEWA